jgi:hypothetical protein
MDWLSQHLEGVVSICVLAFGFTTWNIRQGIRLADMRESMKEYRGAVAEQFKVQQSEIAALRAQQDVVMKTLSDELRRIGEKLAHIEGFLTANRQPTATART